MLNRLKIKLQWRGQSLYAAFALTLAFTACNSSQISKTAQFEPDSFTTEGKPTKTIETPWGPREVYDPSKDVEVLLAIEEIYNRGDVFYGDVHKVSPVRPVKSDKLRSVQLVRHVRRIQDLDMSRAGCGWVASVPCQTWTATILKASCPKPNFGSPELSDCEERNKIHRREIGGGFGPVPRNVDSGFNRRAYPKDAYYACHIDGIEVDGIESRIQTYTKVSKESGYTLDQTKTLLTVSECMKWSTDIDFSYD